MGLFFPESPFSHTHSNIGVHSNDKVNKYRYTTTLIVLLSNIEILLRPDRVYRSDERAGFRIDSHLKATVALLLRSENEQYCDCSVSNSWKAF